MKINNIRVTQTFENSTVPLAMRDEKAYSYGWNTQERLDEIAGSGNHYTAPYWEYDPRVVLRWNTDPKPNPSISPYAIMQGNPIMYTDHKGDTVRTNTEGAENTNMAMEGILDGRTNPIGFDSDKGILTYDENVDISEYSDVQKDVLGRYKELISNEKDVNLKIVDVNEEVYNGQSLKERGEAGLHVTHYIGDKVSSIDVYIARNPVKLNGSSEKKEYAGVTNIHELGGHSYLKLTQPMLKTNDHNRLVEDLHKQIFLNYKVNGAIWYKTSTVPLHQRVEE